MLRAAVRYRIAFNANRAERVFGLEVRSEQVIPDQPELPKVHLRVPIPLPVMPALQLCHAQHMPERA